MVREIMDIPDIAPCQLQSNAYKIIHGLITLYGTKGTQLDTDTIFKLYSIKRSPYQLERIDFLMKYATIPLAYKILDSEYL